jgi:hypothetical protein
MALKKKLSFFGILLLMAVLLVSSLGYGNLVMAASTFPVTVESPIEGEIYTSDSITLRISGISHYPDEYIHSIQITYYIDDHQIGQMPLTVTHTKDQLVSNAIGEIDLTNLPQGPHKLSITGETSGGYYFTPETYSGVPLTPVAVIFFVNLGLHPKFQCLG